MGLPFGARTFQEARDFSRAQVLHGSSVLALLARSYTRDKDGKFSTTGGVRDSLANARTIDEIDTAIAAEAKRITGRDVSVNMAGSDLQIAREHGEGVLRGMEHAPGTRVVAIYTYGPNGARHQDGRDDQGVDSTGNYAHARNGEVTEIAFNNRFSADPARYRQQTAMDEKDSGTVGGGPIGVGIHEFGHVASHQARSDYEREKWAGSGELVKPGLELEAYDHAFRQSGSTDIERYENRRGFVEREISSYASWGPSELTAEAFADVVLHGNKASKLAHEIYDMVTRGPG